MVVAWLQSRFLERHSQRPRGHGRNPEPTGAIGRGLHGLWRAPLLLGLAMGMVACATGTSAGGAGASTTFVLVRHAEKGTDDARDPSLSEAGRARAARLAQLLADSPLSAAYATDYRRTRQTAQPAADGHGIVVTTYDAQVSAAEFAARLRASHAAGTVLVVGHSNTIPQLAAALSGTAAVEMRDDEFDRLYRIKVGADGRAVLSQDSY